ncbi:MAG: 4-hydroxythreonine-4-phosphate dehydrogenase PdxA [Bacteroidales bacterium]|nr:4-hydroxythreonine-4-phosphate dehydrogenase PdxA [Bacteroidales bacterium]MCM1148289.1 4-hydroxythreonine-4-phosphate dehydrogenase PdxA [Bacteroidales bacterium]MCM1206493.1 4-hydroxythreonine-4-phosphate dehydrogenase PdxA [Bacillota bacterium]MCM1510379.1 4-hydroxythreonine-4-phosphate dehydrogenase PdxA [Clostridium sp.]
MNIGILQSAGIAGNIIETALSTPEQDEVFTPIIYSKENGNDKNVGSDIKFGNIAGIVIAPGSATEFKFDGAMTLYVSPNFRLATIFPDITQQEETGNTDINVITEHIRKVWMSLKRDFLISVPRIALIAPDEIKETETEELKSIVAGLAEQGIGVFGPYSKDNHIAQQQFLHFDATIAIYEGQAREMLNTVTEETRTKLLIGIPMAMASTEYDAAYAFDEGDLTEPALALRQAIYTIIDVVRCRTEYDEGHHDPLPKLYHERRDDSEKARFAVRKQQASQDGNN